MIARNHDGVFNLCRFKHAKVPYDGGVAGKRICGKLGPPPAPARVHRHDMVGRANREGKSQTYPLASDVNS